PAPALDPDTGEADVDPRDHGARLWDALIATAAHALATDLAPDAHGARPRITITTDLDTLRHGLGLTGRNGTPDRDPEDRDTEDRVDWLTLDRALPTTDDGLTLTPGVVRR